MTDVTLDDLFGQLQQTQQQRKGGAVAGAASQSVVRDPKKYSALKETINKYTSLDAPQCKPSKQDNNGHIIADIPVVDRLASKKKRQEQREATSGDKWFNMPKGNAEDPKNKKDLMIIQQRAVLDPKRHYKKDKWKVPKYFQMGTVVEDKSEFYSARLKNRERQQTMLQEVLHDKDSTKYFKKKYSEIQDQKAKVVKYKFKKKFKKY